MARCRCREVVAHAYVVSPLKGCGCVCPPVSLSHWYRFGIQSLEPGFPAQCRQSQGNEGSDITVLRGRHERTIGVVLKMESQKEKSPSK